MNGLTTNGASGARRFPEGFLWGAGTSAYQIEGAVDEDGRGPSIWDVFTHTPGTVRGGETGDIACDSYHRVTDDVALLSELGVGAYRFSIAWSRVLPAGRGPVNQAGLDHYRSLVDALREQGIVPVATIYHWELPQALEDEGGWASRDTAELLAQYAAVLAEALGDGVGMWTTVNEPQQSINQGYRVGSHAPGHRDMGLAAAATHHLLLGHGLALQALRAALPATVPVGIALDPHPYRALGDEAEAVAAQLDADHNRICMDPVLHGSYPAEANPELLPPDALIRDGDLAAIGAPVDYVGVNYYRPHYVRAGDWTDLRLGESPVPDHPGFVEYLPPERPQTVMGWLVEPDGLYEILTRLHRETRGLPLYITENGCAAEDYVNPDGEINDTERVDYIHGHLDATLRAIEDGVDVAGYFHWSLLDNFEWAWGYRRRFGLFYVDYGSQRRLPKRSAVFYGGIARSGELPELHPLVSGPSLTPVAES
ncbi:MAG TPA: GH1 family beta-glucosidase [Solirubrobacteraceae bacterium]|nr:GH1 family beta-glucosidase [Solirubrobacteraceae bacterium]